MAANLSPEYKAAEEAYRAAKEPAEKQLCLELMLKTIPKHKGTEKMQADLKTRIAKARQALDAAGPKKGFSVRVEKEGAAQVVLLGAPNAGKSALVEVVTNARVEVGDHPFATRTPVPAMMAFEDVGFQLVDLPPLSRSHLEPFVTDIARTADAALLVVDAADLGFEEKLTEVEEVLRERKIELVAPGPRGPGQEVVRKLPALVVAAKIDEPAAADGVARLRARFEPPLRVVAVSALAQTDFTDLGRAVFDLNLLVRAYSKAPGKEADRSKPFVLHRGATILDFARLVHKDFAEHLQFARVWGHAAFEGQRVPRDHSVEDGDVIELHGS